MNLILFKPATIPGYGPDTLSCSPVDLLNLSFAITLSFSPVDYELMARYLSAP